MSRLDTDSQCQLLPAQVFYIFRNIGVIQVLVIILQLFQYFVAFIRRTVVHDDHFILGILLS